MMKDQVKTSLFLITIGVISAISITYMAQYAYPIIEKNREAALRQAILTVLPGANRYETLDEKNNIYRGLNEKNEIAGYAFVGKGGGYQGIIQIIIGVSRDWQRLTTIAILENVETPGLGAEIASKEFRSQFANLPAEIPIEYILNKLPEKPNQIQAITGATISTRAVVNIINNTIGVVKEVKSKIRQATP